jgi:hypothetical protein
MGVVLSRSHSTGPGNYKINILCNIFKKYAKSDIIFETFNVSPQ